MYVFPSSATYVTLTTSPASPLPAIVGVESVTMLSVLSSPVSVLPSIVTTEALFGAIVSTTISWTLAADSFPASSVAVILTSDVASGNAFKSSTTKLPSISTVVVAICSFPSLSV